MRLPLDGNPKINSPFAPRGSEIHSGVDYEADKGTPVKAITSGTVVRASEHPDYGNVIVIDHGPIGPNGERTYSLYAHLEDNSMIVKPGDTVNEGDVIGESGNSGRSRGKTGDHLHFEVIKSITPLPWRETGPM